MTKRTRNLSQQEWLNQQQAADYLGVTDRSIRNYIARGDLVGYKMRGSRLVRLRRSDLDEMMRAIPAVDRAGA